MKKDFNILILGSDFNSYCMARCYHELYNEKVEEYLSTYDMESEAALKEKYGEEKVNDAILTELVMDFLMENAVITEAE